VAGGAEQSADGDQVQKYMRHIKEGPTYLKMLLSGKYKLRMQEVQEKHGCSIRLSGIGEYFPYHNKARKALVISGEQENVLAVLDGILSEAPDEKVAFDFLLPRSVGGKLIGVGGEKIQKIERATSTSINIKAAGFEEVVTVYGSRQSIKAVAEWLLGEQTAFVDDMKEHLTVNYLGCTTRGLDASCTIYMPIPQDKVRLIVGKQGETIKRIGSEFRVRLSIDDKIRDADGNSIMKITGGAGSVHAAHAKMLNSFLVDLVDRRPKKRPASQVSPTEAADVLSAASAEPATASAKRAPLEVGR